MADDNERGIVGRGGDWLLLLLSLRMTTVWGKRGGSGIGRPAVVLVVGARGGGNRNVIERGGPSPIRTCCCLGGRRTNGVEEGEKVVNA
jgi:hypothetical protein